jgi:membrane protein implicated in regulation of membrane protease activity
LYCLSFSFDHCIVCLFLLAIVLSVFFFWPLYCLSFSFSHCIVCLFLLTDKTMNKRKRQTIQWSKEKDRQYNDQKKKTDNTMIKEKEQNDNDLQNTTQ